MRKDLFTGRTVLVTGGTGSIGSVIVRQLLDLGVNRVFIFNRDEINQYIMSQEIDDPRLEFIMGDIRDYESIENVFLRNPIDIVFHAAAMKHLVVCENEPIESARVNIVGTHNLIRLCAKYRVARTVMISTDKAASPTSVMGATKFIAERITLNGNQLSNGESRFCCVRFGNVSNSRGSIIPVMTKRILKGKDIWVSDPDATRFIIRTEEAVKLVFKAAELTRGGELFVLKMRAFRVGDVGLVFRDRIAPMLRKKVRLETRALVPGEKINEDLLNHIEYVNLLEDEEMFISSQKVVLDPADYPGFRKSEAQGYTSFETDLLNLDDIEEMAMEYLKSEGIIRG